MGDYLSMAVGEMKSMLGQLIQNQRDHREILEEISDKLDRLHLKPPPRQSFDIREHLRLIWRLGLGAAVLFGYLKLPPGEASKLLLKLL